MTDEELRLNLSELEAYEGRVSWMYLDSATPANVTVGVGCLLASVDDACALPFRIVGFPAAREAIAAEFLRVSSMPGGLRAKAYRKDMFLQNADIDALAFQRMRNMLADLPAIFPGFEAFPLGVRQALLDLGWNCGLGAYPGLRGWSKLIAASNSVPPDWSTAAIECRTANPNKSPSREKRNNWRSQCFLDAAAQEGSTS